MKKGINWSDFENTSINLTVDFERLCRIIFKRYFVKNPYVILKQIHNNPGIETDPIDVDGELVGFQAKYFTNKISYADILDSVKKIKDHYNDKIDRVIIFSNKDINDKTKSFIEIKKILDEINCSYTLFCNDNILELINDNNDYNNLKYSFFNEVTISNEWICEKLEITLKDLEPRYSKDFHIQIEEEIYLNCLLKNQKFFEYLHALKSNSIETLKNDFYLENNLKDRIISVINCFEIPSQEEIYTVFSWFGQLKEFIEEINKTIETNDCEINELKANSKEDFKYKISDLYNKNHHLSMCLDVINDFDMEKNPHTMYLDTNILVVEGDAGVGKSHLLGYIANQTKEDSHCNCILFLGQKIIGNNNPQKQLVDSIGYNGSFDSFLECLENNGQYDGSTTVLMIDAINESKYSEVWMQYINELTLTIEKYKFIKLVLSVRSTYKEYVFNEAFINKLLSGDIPTIKLNGFRYNLIEAVSSFFKYYHLPLTIDANFNNNFENPMFLKLYCVASQAGNQYGGKNIMEVYYAYIQYEENKIKSANSIKNSIFLSKQIFSEIAKYYYENDCRSVPYFSLIKICKNIPYYKELIDGLIHSKVLVEYLDLDGNSIIYLCYEKLGDYILAKYILDTHSNKKNADDYIVNNFFRQDGKMFHSYKSIGIFTALSVIYNEKYGDEIIRLIPEDYDDNRIKIILDEYLINYSYRENEYIDSKLFYAEIIPFIKKTNSRDSYFELLLKLATRECSLNSDFLFRILSELSLSNRDIFWTTYINDHYYKSYLLFNVVSFYSNFDSLNYTENECRLALQLLIFMLSSTNRELRDIASRAIVKILQYRFKFIEWSLKRFENINDFYIISRLYGCCYGAILQMKTEVLNDDANRLVCYIKTTIFENTEKYCDILLRDYALNILEFIDFTYGKVADLEKCKPPYKTSDIQDISIKELKLLYEGKNVPEGYDRIKWSLAPDISIKDFTTMYGDFGRYTFEYALSNFKNINIEKIFKYAYYYIIKKLGYNDELSCYDKNRDYGRGRTDLIERIEKKYQWIAMYHILAIIADNYEYSEKYTDYQCNKYKGTWRPYVRDFDPSLNLKNNDRIYALKSVINIRKYTQWNISNDKWAYIDDVNNFKDNITVEDSKKSKWISLYFSQKDKIEDLKENIRQSIWKSSTACLIKLEEKDKFISFIKGKSFYGRWMNVAECKNNYNIFLREYYWSPAAKDEFEDTDFQKVEIEVGKEKITKEIPEFNFKNNVIEYISKEVELPVYKTIGSLSVCMTHYLWEEEYDYSKEETVSIYLPSMLIVKLLSLHQKEDGLWYDCNDNLCCVDFSLVKGSNVDGLYLREECLREIKNKGYDILWIGMGEKISSDPHYSKSLGFNEISSLVYFENNEVKEVIITNHR